MDARRQLLLLDHQLQKLERSRRQLNHDPSPDRERRKRDVELEMTQTQLKIIQLRRECSHDQKRKPTAVGVPFFKKQRTDASPAP